MKKLLFFIFFIAFAFSVSGQDVTFFQNTTQKTFTADAGDTLNASYLLTKSIAVQKDYLYMVNVQVSADSLGDGTDITCYLRGSWDNSTFENISSVVTWYLIDSDTTFSMNSLAYTESYAGTNTIATYNITSDTAGYYGYVYPASDTVKVGEQTITVTNTVTKSLNGLMYPYLQVYFLGGGAGADMLLDNFIMRIIPYKYK